MSFDYFLHRIAEAKTIPEVSAIRAELTLAEAEGFDCVDASRISLVATIAEGAIRWREEAFKVV